MIDDVVMKSNIQVVKVDSKTFTRRIGWDDTSSHLFYSIGFKLQNGKLSLPDLNPSNPQSNINRFRLMRAWIEVGVLLLIAKSKCSFFPSNPQSGWSCPLG